MKNNNSSRIRLKEEVVINCLSKESIIYVRFLNYKLQLIVQVNLLNKI